MAMKLSSPVNVQMYAPKFQPQAQQVVDPNSLVPPYGSRTNYMPRKPADYGDGGAFPEIHVKQYPLDMGRKKSTGGGQLQLRIDQQGKTNYDVVVREGQRKGKTIFTQLSESSKMDIDQDDLARPNAEEAKEMIKKAREGLEKKLQGRLKASAPRGPGSREEDKPIYVRYTPANQNTQHNSGARSRIIKVHKMQVDPMEPPKFKHKKGPTNPPSPPVPIMRSPPRSITQEDQKNWKIPPCVSNWKNNRGYAIPLHQRLATSGRNLKETPINDKFASLAEALYFAEREARKEVENRAAERKMRNEQLRKKREKDLHKIARDTQTQFTNNQQREIDTPYSGGKSADPADLGTPVWNEPTTPSTFRDIGTPVAGGRSPGITKEAIRKRNERERLREEAKRRRKRQQGLEKAKGNVSGGRRERDVSEQIALGQNVNSNSGEMAFDQRLFNKDSGIASGFTQDDVYDIYDKPMTSSVNQHLYRPTVDESINADEEVEKLIQDGPKFVPHRAFKDTEGQKSSSGPVQFEKVHTMEKEEDPFALGDLEKSEKKPKPKPAVKEEKERDRRRRRERDEDRRDRRRRDRREREDRSRKRRSRSSSPRKRRKKRRHD